MAEIYIGNNQIGGGTPDLSNYYNKSEIDSSFADTYLVKISNASGQYYYVPRTMSDADKQAILSRANSSSGAIIFDNPINSSDNIFGKGAIMIGNSYAKGTKAIAYGYQTEALGNYTHSEGYGSKAMYSAAHAEGYFTTASGAYSHAEGNTTTASSINAHAEGEYTIASGLSSHAEGWGTTASGPWSHAEGANTVANLQNQHVEGEYNADASNALHIIGNGEFNKRHNALEVHLSGEVKIPDTHAEGEAYEKPMYVLQDKLYQIDSSIAALEANSGSGGVDLSVINASVNNIENNYVKSEDIAEYTYDKLHIDASFIELALKGGGGGGTPDLSGYYTKSEIDSSFADICLVKITNATGQYYYVPRTMSDADKQAILSRANSSSGAIIFDNPANSSDNIFGSGAIMIGNSYAKGTKAFAHGYQTEATGNYTHAEGYGSKATYSASHAEGYFTTASGRYSHAEGQETTASGADSHAEGNATSASGDYSHAEGYFTTALGAYSHAEGGNTYTSGQYSHAEGSDASAMNYASHAEGYRTKANAIASHAEGYYTVAQKLYQHVEGQYNADASNAIHITGNGTINGRHNALEVHLSGEIYIPDTHASGNAYQKPMFVLLDKLYQIDSSIAALEAKSGGGSSSDFNYVITYGNNNLIRSTISSEKQTNIKTLLNSTQNAIVLSELPLNISIDYLNNYGSNSLSLGVECQASGTSSVAHGYQTEAAGGYSHTEGNATSATGGYSHAEGNSTNANASYSHAEGNSTKANGEGAHAEGKDTSAYADYSHAEGTLTSATGLYSHAEGRLSVASGLYSHAEGGITEANQNYQHVEGTCNVTVANALHIIGNGTSRLNKHNAFEVHKSGEIFISDIYSSGEVYQKSMMSLNAKLKEINDLRNSITTESLILEPNVGVTSELYIRDSNGDLYQLDIDALCQQYGTLVQE